MNANYENDLEMPYSELELKRWGYTHWRCLLDGTVVAVAPMSISNGRLFWNVHQDGYEDFYCYDSVELAVTSMMEFDPTTQLEPLGWHRHGSTGRRRPGGDMTKEYINK
ncbi:hypothetical protein [Flavobacterium sp.]|uniref:hypothetical protein n=1 Tax=Flavobacterium sp. TaxID=239 RepID=UPI002631E6BA|nr:hypothetical protein [Flavobacterium sp.]